MLIFTHNKERLLEHFRRDPVLFAYHIGDLDDFFFEHCQWGATYHKSTAIDECLLVYGGGAVPTVLAFGLSERFPDLLDEALPLLPSRFYCHYFEIYREMFAELYEETQLGSFRKMQLAEFVPHHSAADEPHLRRLGRNDMLVLTQLYKHAYPGNYFDPRMLETGKYFGYFVDNQIVAAAGIHVYSREYNVAVLGNIATAIEQRGRGYATRVTSRLVSELADEGRLIALNVRADNEHAIKCYDNLGFVVTHDYEESIFTLEG